jgi:uncharacterized repeat protein (TIGR03837 family)
MKYENGEIKIDAWELIQYLPEEKLLEFIETFACHLPDAYRMALKHYPTFWLNLEYFSAEDWVIGCHRLPSLQYDGLKKYFFMPSIRQAAGGLLREAGLIEARDAFCCDSQQQLVWREQYQMADGVEAGIKISLFSYENPTMPHLIDALIHAPCPVNLYVPESKSLISLNQHLGLALRQGHHHQQGKLHIHVLPFLPQADYDRLLWWCDLNLVRGEDSLVRAIWAGKPFIWQIYPTEDLAHQDKLHAFAQHYYSDAEADSPIISAMLAWNQMQEVDWRQLVQQFVITYSPWQQMARLASEQQVYRSSLSQEVMVWLNNIFDSHER